MEENFRYGSRFWYGFQRILFLKTQNVNDWQNAGGIEDDEADIPRQLVVTRTLPHGNRFPDGVPDGQQNDYSDKQRDQGSFHIDLSQG